MQGERRPLCVSEAAPVRGRRIWQAHNVSLCCSALGCKGGWRGGEATSRTRKFPNYVPALGFAFLLLSFPSAVRTVTLWGEKKKKNSKLGAHDSPGFGSLVNVRHWKGPLTGATFYSAETACHSRPGRLRRARSLMLFGRRGGAGGGRRGRRRGERGAAPGLLPSARLCAARACTGTYCSLSVVSCSRLCVFPEHLRHGQIEKGWA